MPSSSARRAPWTETGAPASPLDAALGPLMVRAGDEATLRFRSAKRTLKADSSVVTEADHAAERVLVEGLSALFPDDTIIAEEGGSRAAGEVRWVVDPLDGTSAFTEGLAHWGPTVGRLVGDRVAVGALWMPRLHEYYYYERGVGAFRSGTRLAPQPWPDAAPAHSDVLFIPSRLHAYATLDWPGKARCLGSVAAHLCLVAAGGAVAALIGPGWRHWDVACGLGLLRELGGQARLADGRELDLGLHEGRAFLAGSPAALAWLAGDRVVLRQRREPPGHAPT